MKQPVSRKVKGVKVKPRPVNNNTYNPKTGRITYGSNYEFDSNEDRDAFFNTYWNDAEKATTGSLIKPETLLSQAYVETLGGRNMPKNNMFGLPARKPEENPERYSVGIYETHEYFDTPDYYKTIDINGETFIDDEYKDKKLYGTELVTEGKNKGRYKYKVDRYFREYESIEEGMKGYIDNFSETSAYKSSMEELNSKPEDQKSFLKGISSSYSTSLGYDSTVIKNYDYFNKRADKRRMKNKLLYTDANIADNVLKFKDGGFPIGNVEAEGRELVLRNSHGDMAIIPKKYRQEALDMIKEGCDGCLDNLISTLPKISDYNK